MPTNLTIDGLKLIENSPAYKQMIQKEIFLRGYKQAVSEILALISRYETLNKDSGIIEAFRKELEQLSDEIRGLDASEYEITISFRDAQSEEFYNAANQKMHNKRYPDNKE